jgi:hypothetical protein
VKGLTVPTRSTFTFTMGGKPISFGNIVVDGKIYTPHKDGTWKIEKSDSNEAKIRKAWADDVCTPGGSETIDGEVADVVLNHKGGSMPLDSRFFISQTSGLIVRTDTVMPHSTIEAVYDYRDVQLPPDALAAPGP